MRYCPPYSAWHAHSTGNIIWRKIGQ
jgi:hypothetical protein